jgi:ribosome-interacting GTPase 1
MVVFDRQIFMPMQEYKIHNAEVLFREDCDADDLIDVIEGNRRYIKCL